MRRKNLASTVLYLVEKNKISIGINDWTLSLTYKQSVTGTRKKLDILDLK